jgi:hypothetical protein
MKQIKSKHPKKGGIQGTKQKDPRPKKTKEPPKRTHDKGNIKFLNPFLLQESYQIRKEEDLLNGMPSLEETSPIATAHLKREIACTCYNTTVDY